MRSKIRRNELTDEQARCLQAIQEQCQNQWQSVVLNFHNGRPEQIKGEPDAVAFMRQIRNGITSDPDLLPDLRKLVLTHWRGIAPDEIIAEIDAFEKQCRAQDYTDSGDAWNLLEWIRECLSSTDGGN